MSHKKARGFEFVIFKGDHMPFHVHIFKDGKEICRWDIENQRTMEDVSINHDLKKALIELGYMLEIK